MGARRLSPELSARVVKEVLENYRSVEDVGAEFGISPSTVARHAAIERRGRQERAAAERAARDSAPVVVQKDAKLIALQGSTIKALREENDLLKSAFDKVRNVLVETENALDE